MTHRLHVVSLPHTTLTERNSSCAYSMKVAKFCPMMLEQECEVILYGPDEVDERFQVSEHVVITTQGDRERWGFGDGFNTATTPFEWDAGQPYWAEPAQKAIDAIRERARPRDYLCLITGTQWPIAQAISGANSIRGPIACEFGVGYEGVYTPFCAFESHAWMNHVYGIRHWSNGRVYDQVIPNFFDETQFYVDDSPEDYLLYMGRVVPRKGADIAAEIAERVDRPLIVAGPGPISWEKGRIVAPDWDGSRFVIEGNVEYVGEVGFADRAELMAKAAAVIVPTKYIEPFGGVAVEALMSGAPVIGSDWGAFPELLTPAVGRTFRTIRQGAEAVEECLSLDRQAIREYAISRFSMDVVGPLFARWFDQLDTLWGKGYYE